MAGSGSISTIQHPCLCLCLSAGDHGLLVCRLDNSALATEKESRLLLYQDMDSDLDNLSCSERLAKAHFTSKLPAFTHTRELVPDIMDVMLPY